MRIAALGELLADRHGDWRSHPVPVSYVDGVLLPFVVDAAAANASSRDLDRVVETFLGLTTASRRSASRWVHAHYLDTVDAIRSRPHLYLPAAQPILDLPIRVPEDVWSHVAPNGIGIERRDEDGLLYALLGLNVPWDEEHGLTLFFRGGGELSRVDHYDGHLTTADAYGLPETEDRIYFSRADVLRRLEQRDRKRK